MKRVWMLFCISVFFFSGCRVGNRSAIQLKGYDLISGYYQTHPKTLNLLVETDSGSQTQSVNIRYLPHDLKLVMYNPVLIFYDSLADGLASIRSPYDTSVGFKIPLPEGETRFSSENRYESDDDDCTFQQTMYRDGELLQFPDRITQGDFETRGSLGIKLRLDSQWLPQTSCTDLLTLYQDCYQDPSTCSESDAQWVLDLVQPFMDTGMLTDAQISHLKRLQWTAEYQ